MDLKTLIKKIFGTLEHEVQTEVDRVKQKRAESQAQRKARPQPRWATYQGEHTEAEWIAYFKEILAQKFGEFAVRENVPVQELVGDVSEEFQLYPTRPYQAYKAEWGLPYTFVLYKGDQIHAVILLAKSENQYKHVKFLISKMYAKKMNIPFINFYMDAPNERDYVEYRIAEFLGLES